jgi:hypothetical protein
MNIADCVVLPLLRRAASKQPEAEVLKIARRKKKVVRKKMTKAMEAHHAALWLADKHRNWPHNRKAVHQRRTHPPGLKKWDKTYKWD